jgi:hypothetical protein
VTRSRRAPIACAPWSAALSRSLERRLNLGSKQIEVQPIGSSGSNG